MPAEFLAKLVEDISARGHVPGEIWFRGHADASWPLVPQVVRKGLSAEQEKNMLARYRYRAMGMVDNEPEDDDPARWLFLMQHHGLPTRLLDWTESALAALFFAVDSMPQSDGCLFLLAPMVLNEGQIGEAVILAPNASLSRQMMLASFKGDAQPDKIVATVACGREDRLARQRSCFTVHGIAADLRGVGDAGGLSSLVVPSALKPGLQTALAYLGVTRTSLFHDLDALAIETRQQWGFA